jgi:hypothetical protein
MTLSRPGILAQSMQQNKRWCFGRSPAPVRQPDLASLDLPRYSRSGVAHALDSTSRPDRYAANSAQGSASQAEPSGPGRRHRRMRHKRGRFSALLGAAAALTLLAGCGTATAGRNAQARDVLNSTVAPKTCDLPANPPVAPGQKLTGPAVTALTGGAAVHGFSLDGGKFSIARPPAGDVPRVSRTQAECEEQAAVGPSGYTLSLEDSGMAAGYGLVTVSHGLPLTPWQQDAYPDVSLSTPTPASYQGRLAWVVVFRYVEVASCPSQTAGTPPATPKYTGYYYDVFIVDAATGADALLYTERAPLVCDQPGFSPPSLAIPIEQTSVPWRLDSRAANGYYGTLTAYVPPCDGYDKEVSVVPGTALVRVLSYGQVAANCGSPRPVAVYLQAADVFQSLPSKLVHAQTGLYLTEPQSQGGQEPAATGKIVTVGVVNSGQTFTVHVGDVISPTPFPVNPMHAPLVHSSDPAVLGLLGAPQLQTGFSEFRAWRPGRATLTSSYHGWTVRFIVLAR